jgi:tetratricopeptide (TPR) repeat protein
MIDLFESILKTHTAVIMGEYFSRSEISNEVKGLLADGLRTPSLGTWQLFSRVLLKELVQKNHSFVVNNFQQEFDWLDTSITKKQDVIAFRNGYAHGATPSDEQCDADILKFEPFLQQLLNLSWLNNSLIIAVNGQVIIKDTASGNFLSLYPIICLKPEEDNSPYVFFNDLKSNKVGLLNYTLSKHYRDKDFYDAFNEVLPLQEWKKSGSHEFKQRIEELTETFKGRTAERSTIKTFVEKNDKGYLSIQGNPGIGKSALVAQVFKDLSQEELKSTIQLTEYFIRRGTQQAQPTFLLEYLIKKTDTLFAQGKTIKAEGKTNYEIQQALFEKWRLYGEQNTVSKLVFLIDGLDEGVENSIMNYLPRENFKNILFIYGSRPGGHKDIENFWGQLPVEQHTKIELQGLSRQDIRALLYDVANKYELQEDWIGILEERSQGNPLYLKLLCNALEDGSIHINDSKALPKEINEYYKAILLRYAGMPDGDALLNSLFVFGAAIDYLTPAHLTEILGFGPATQTNVMGTLVEVLCENPITETVLDYQLFHESLREYLKKDRATEVAKAEQKIIEFCGRWKTFEGNYEQQYVLRHYAGHLSTQQNETHHHALIALTKDAEFIDKQKKVLRNFVATHQLYQYGIEIATKNNWNEAAIDCGLGIVDVKYEEQNDVTAILEMVKHNEMDLALQRITVLGGPSAEDKERQFIVIMLCIMELTLLESKTQPWRKSAIEKLLVLMEEQIPVDHSVLNWNDFFPSYLIFLMAIDLNEINLNYLEIYKRTSGWDNEWVEIQGPYSDEQLNVITQVAEGMISDFEKSSAYNKIAVVLGNQGKQEESSKLLEKSIQTAEGIISDYKSSAFSQIAFELIKLGKLDDSRKLLYKSIHTAERINNDWNKNDAFEKIAIVLANQGEIEKSIQTVERINDYIKKSSTFNVIAVVLANQGKLKESSKLLEKSFKLFKTELVAHGWNNQDLGLFSVFKEIAVVLANQGEIKKSIKTIDGLHSDGHKSSAFKEVAVVLANKGKQEESSKLIEKSIQMAEGINDDRIKSSAFKEVAVVLANQGKLEESSKLLEKSIHAAEGINNHGERGDVLVEIAVFLANQGEINKSIQVADGNDRWSKNDAFSEIAVVLANQGEIEKSIQTAEVLDEEVKFSVYYKIALLLVNQGKLEESKILLDKSIQSAEVIKSDSWKISAFSKIAVVLANQGEIEKSIQTAEVLDDWAKNSAFSKIAVLFANNGEIEKSIEMAERINEDWSKNSAFSEIAVVLANQGEIEKSIQIAEGINNDCTEKKISAFKGIAVVLANQGKQEESSKLLEKSIQMAERINDDWSKNSAFSEIAVILANQGEILESADVLKKINRDDQLMNAWLKIGKDFYKKDQLQNLDQTLAQLPNDEAVTFFKKGIAQSITATNATEETILQILPFVKADKESTEHLLQMHALYCTFFEKMPKEKIKKFNRTLNIKWALDIIAKFPKEENGFRLSTNLEEWIEEVGDEDDREQIELWAKQVIKGKITEEEFGERVNGIGLNK